MKLTHGEAKQTIVCPHCGNHLHIVLDASNGDQDFFEECPNCCHDIHINLHLDDLHRTLDVIILSDDEQVY